MTQQMKTFISDCNRELIDITTIMNNISSVSNEAKYLTHYALIKAEGTIEYAYRSIIYDYFKSLNNSKINNYLEETVKKGSMSGTIYNMKKLLKQFDYNWLNSFETLLKSRQDKKKLESSCKALVENRHLFAHGQNTTITFNDIKNYYNDALIVINIFDSVVI